MKKIHFYNISDLHVKESDLDEMEKEVKSCFLYKDDKIVIYKALAYTITIITLNNKRYNNIDELPSNIRNIVLKEMI